MHFKTILLKGFVDLVCGLLKDASIDINKCRGQGYDGASVMSGAYSGVKKEYRALFRMPLMFTAYAIG